MSEFINKSYGFLHYLLGASSSEQQQAILLAVGLLSGLFIFSRVSAAANVSHNGVSLTLLVYLVGLAALFTGVLLLDEYVIGEWLAVRRMTGVFLSTIVVSLLIVVPLICMVQQCRYAAGTYVWFIALFVMVFTMIIARSGLDVMASGGENASKMQKRNAEVQELFQESK